MAGTYTFDVCEMLSCVVCKVAVITNIVIIIQINEWLCRRW